MEERMNKEELLKLLSTLKVDKDEFWILSSGALVLRGVMKDAGDLDIAVTEKGLEQIKKQFDVVYKERGWYTVNDKIECVCDGKIENLIYKPERLDNGYLIQNIYEYYDFVKHSTREKDKPRVEIVENYLRNLTIK